MSEIKAALLAFLLVIMPLFIVKLPVPQFFQLLPLMGIYILAYFLLLPKDRR